MESPYIATPRGSPVALIVSASFFVGLAGLVFASLAALLVAPLLTDGKLPEGWSWPSAAALVAMSLLVLALFGGSLYRRVNTKLEPDGLVVPTLRGGKLIRWAEVERVSGRGMHIKLHTSTIVVIVNPLCYASPAEAVAFLMANVPVKVPSKGAA